MTSWIHGWTLNEKLWKAIRPPALMPEMELHLAASAWFAMASQYHPVSPWSWSHWQRADQEFEPFRTIRMKKSVSTAWFFNCPWYFSEKEFLFYCFLPCFSVCILSTSIIDYLTIHISKLVLSPLIAFATQAQEGTFSWLPCGPDKATTCLVLQWLDFVGKWENALKQTKNAPCAEFEGSRLPW